MPTVLIRISGAADPYAVELFTDTPPAPAGVAWHQRPVAAGQLPPGCVVPTRPHLNLAAVRARFVTSLAQARPTRPEVQEVGQYLFDLLAAVEPEWQKARAVAPVRTILEVGPPALASVPWEALTDTTGDRLFQSNLLTVCRARGPLRFDHEPRPLRGLLRVLVVVGHPPRPGAGQPPTHFRAELDGLRAVFRQVSPVVDWEILPQPDRKKLTAALDEYQPDVLHFVGHGTVANGEAVLVMTPADGTPTWAWTAKEIRERFGRTDKPVPRLAVFSACFSGASAESDTWSLARAVLDFPPGPRGADAAVCMSAAVEGAAAATFAAAFYKGLAYRLPADVACAAARAEVVERHGLDVPDWAVPALHLRVHPDRLFPPDWGLTPDLADKFRQDVEDTAHRESYYARALAHVDRQEHRRALVGEVELLAWASGFRPVTPAVPDGLRKEIDAAGKRPGRLLVVTGPRDVGKTDLGVCTVACAQALGLLGVYVNLADGAALDYPRVLRRVREAGREGGMMDALPAEPFATFDALAGGANPAVLDLTRAFLDGLAQASAARPVLLVLDQLTGPNGAGVVATEFGSVAVRHLLAPLARGEVRNVITLLIATTEEYQNPDLGLAALRPRVPARTIQPFDPQHVRDHATDYCLYRSYFDIDRESAEQAIGLAERRVRNPWLPDEVFSRIALWFDS